MNLLKSLLKDFLQVLLLLGVKQIPPVPPPVPVPLQNDVIPEPKYKWGNPQEVRHSIRVIGDEFGMTWAQKDLLCDIARCESGFKPTATLKNSPKSIDRGLYQWNNYYHPEITDAIAYDPEQNTRLACKALLAGRAKAYWSASMHCWNAGGKYDAIL